MGLLCVQEDPTDRPTMSTIVLMLNSYSVTLPAPQQPAFFFASRRETSMATEEFDFDQSKSKSIPWSVDDASITQFGELKYSSSYSDPYIRPTLFRQMQASKRGDAKTLTRPTVSLYWGDVTTSVCQDSVRFATRDVTQRCPGLKHPGLVCGMHKRVLTKTGLTSQWDVDERSCKGGYKFSQCVCKQERKLLHPFKQYTVLCSATKGFIELSVLVTGKLVWILCCKERILKMGNICTSERQDRIGELPDDILLHILSFLSIGEVFRTSALSTRWKHLCTLKYAWITTSQLQPWISAAIRCNLQELEHSLGYVPLPDNAFTLKSLIVMEVKDYFIFSDDSDSFTQQTAQNALKLMSGLYNVKSLTLSGDIFKHLFFEENLQDGLPMFHRLTHLKVIPSNLGYTDYLVWKDILQKSPNIVPSRMTGLSHGYLSASTVKLLVALKLKIIPPLLQVILIVLQFLFGTVDPKGDPFKFLIGIAKMGNICKIKRKDRISELPDHILLHILSFLPIRGVLRTSALSTRWKHLRTLITDIDYDDSTYGLKVHLDTNFYIARERSLIFHAHLIKSWISAATKCNLQELELSLDGVLLLDNTFLA
ncbi:hypothetical protein Patl1_03700 [Pistacia atlantica]|uniref:Uncharacterized protein n=1 Tax=Pistacia atlantica TaxID=434234 RepID=A0ACC1BQB5_9ROSI|nr:hypothetical protein Patl1_03700 [Pistacia atlantica]